MTASQQMRAATLKAGRVTVMEAPLPAPPFGYALIRVLATGICNTDLELQRGYYSFEGIPGHEFVGRVTAGGSSSLIGQRVSGEINLACGQCDFCLTGQERHCAARTVLGILGHPGAFAEYLTLPEANLHVLPDTISDREAVFIEPLAAAWHIAEQIQLKPQEPVAVLGDGKLGLLVAQALAVAGAPVTLYGRHERKLRLAAAWGVAIGISDAEKYPIVVDCSGSAAGLEQAIRMTRPLGRLVMKSTVQDAVKLDMAPVIVNEISLIGSRCGRFEPAIELLASKKIDVEDMIDAEYPLEQAAEAFAKAAEKGVLKVLLRP